MDHIIREISRDEYPLLKRFLYEAIFVPEGMPRPPQDIVYASELRVYWEAFGESESDAGVVCEVGGSVVGAAWARIMPDYGHVDDETPSLAISLYGQYRGKGFGTLMLRSILELLRRRGFESVSLSVQKANYAVGMYRAAGFEVLCESEDEYIMLCRLRRGKRN